MGGCFSEASFRSTGARLSDNRKSLHILKLWIAAPPSSIPRLDRFVTKGYRADAISSRGRTRRPRPGLDISSLTYRTEYLTFYPDIRMLH